MATADTNPATDTDDEQPGWTTEVELRRHLRSKYPDDDTETALPCAPDPARAADFEPDGKHSDYCRNDYLRSLDGIEVYDDRIIVPRETVERLEADDPDTFDDLDQLAYAIYANMRVREEETRKGKSRYVMAKADHLDDFDDYTYPTPPRVHRRKRETADVRETDPRPIYLRLPRDSRFNRLQQLYENRKRDGRTLLVIIIARDAATGTGKTTLACQLAKSWDTHGWTADRATLDPGTYADKYTDDDTPSKSVLLLDEAEQAADNRRSMSNQNVKLSHLWATMRFREIYSIITLPSASMLDKRLKELADVKIVVHERGTAVAYKTKIDDHDGSYRAKRLCRLRWDHLDDDPEYQRLTDKKAERMGDYADTFAYDDDDDDLDPEQARRDYRLQVVERMSAAGYTQAEIADALPDISDRSTVSKLLNRDE